MRKTPPFLPRAVRSIFLGAIALVAGCSSGTPPAEAPANDTELRGPLEDRALMQSEYQRVR